MMDWRIGIMVLAVCLFVIVMTRFVSVGSMLGCLLYPLFVLAYLDGEVLLYKKLHLLLAVVLGLLGLFRHRSNIKKLLKGEESQIGKKAEN